MFIHDKNNSALLLLACKVATHDSGFVYKFPIGIKKLSSIVVEVKPLTPIAEQILAPYQSHKKLNEIVPKININQKYRDEFHLGETDEKTTVYLAEVDLINDSYGLNVEEWVLISSLLKGAVNKSQRLCLFRVFQVLQGFLNSEVNALEVLEGQKIADAVKADDSN